MTFEQLKERIWQRFKLDLNSYKQNQLKRRLDNFIIRKELKGYQDFFQQLVQSKELYSQFIDNLTINVSEFFRDSHIFNTLEQEILPGLLAKKQKLKIWSAACSFGAEPYSVAMILDKLSPGIKHTIDATDLDPKILENAKAGKYSPDSIKKVRSDRLNKYFYREGDSYLVNELIKNKVNFRVHDLLYDPYPSGYDLVICRNVTIYFTKEAQYAVYRKFHKSLNSNGILFIGGSETIFNAEEIGFKKIGLYFYKKV